MDSLRLSDAERQQALEVLGEHFAQGRLTREELDERSDAVWSARTHGDLSPLFADLPTATSGPVAHPVAGPRRRRGRGLMLPIVVVLVVLTVVTHLPFVLVALALWFVVVRSHGGRYRRGARGALHW